jgi:hypothetical protein
MTAVDLSLFPDDESTAAAVHGDPPECCFYCGDPLAEISRTAAALTAVWPGTEGMALRKPIVIWHGSGRTQEDHGVIIGLHADCAIELAAHLGKDAINARHGNVERGKFETFEDIERLDEDVPFLSPEEAAEVRARVAKEGPVFGRYAQCVDRKRTGCRSFLWTYRPRADPPVTEPPICLYCNGPAEDIGPAMLTSDAGARPFEIPGIFCGIPGAAVRHAHCVAREQTRCRDFLWNYLPNAEPPITEPPACLYCGGPAEDIGEA